MSDFSKNMAQWAAKAKAGVDEVTRAAIIDTSTRIIRRTPVDTGRARGNWFVGIDSPVTTTNLAAIDKEGVETIKRVTAMADDAVGKVFYLTNNLPYIGRLEYQGWSTQAPVGMVRVSVIEFNDALRKAISKVQ